MRAAPIKEMITLLTSTKVKDENGKGDSDRVRVCVYVDNTSFMTKGKKQTKYGRCFVYVVVTGSGSSSLYSPPSHTPATTPTATTTAEAPRAFNPFFPFGSLLPTPTTATSTTPTTTKAATSLIQRGLALAVNSSGLTMASASNQNNVDFLPNIDQFDSALEG